jgi:hypothetical protein
MGAARHPAYDNSVPESGTVSRQEVSMEQFGKSDWIDFEMVESHRREIQQLIENEKLARQVPHDSLIEHVIAWLRRREPEETAIPIQKAVSSHR